MKSVIAWLYTKMIVKAVLNVIQIAPSGTKTEMLEEIIACKNAQRIENYIELDGRYCVIRTLVRDEHALPKTYARTRDFSTNLEAQEFLAEYLKQAEERGATIIKEAEFAYAVKE